MSGEQKKLLVRGLDYQYWKKQTSGKHFLLVVYVDDGCESTTVLIDIPVAMTNEGLTQRVWEWLGMNQQSDIETEGPAGKWLDGIREDTESLACQLLETPILSKDVVMMHVRQTYV